MQQNPQNQDVSLQIKKLDNQILRRIHTLYDRRKLQECTLQNMWVTDFLFHKEQQEEPVFQRDVEEEFAINRATASKMLALMEEKGLIRRVSDAQDGRRKALQLEPAGRELQRRYSAIRQELEQQLVSGFSPEELDQLRRFLARMQANL
ncbi:MarR family transcriptional regulator [Fournierella sp.]|uniref:MarR family winged helix-turn-helix transcriptional regulator n=1 Tax=Allofournierella sp. TaxID=1940256 RepID=UPI00307AEEAA